MSDAGTMFVLGRMLFKITALQLIGYYFKTTKILPPAAEAGIGAFLGKLSLPALLFRALATLDSSAPCSAAQRMNAASSACSAPAHVSLPAKPAHISARRRRRTHVGFLMLELAADGHLICQSPFWI